MDVIFESPVVELPQVSSQQASAFKEATGMDSSTYLEQLNTPHYDSLEVSERVRKGGVEEAQTTPKAVAQVEGLEVKPQGGSKVGDDSPSPLGMVAAARKARDMLLLLLLLLL